MNPQALRTDEELKAVLDWLSSTTFPKEGNVLKISPKVFWIGGPFFVLADYRATEAQEKVNSAYLIKTVSIHGHPERRGFGKVFI